jgi:hypothetical protein
MTPAERKLEGSRRGGQSQSRAERRAARLNGLRGGHWNRFAPTAAPGMQCDLPKAEPVEVPKPEVDLDPESPAQSITQAFLEDVYRKQPELRPR